MNEESNHWRTMTNMLTSSHASLERRLTQEREAYDKLKVYATWLEERIADGRRPLPRSLLRAACPYNLECEVEDQDGRIYYSRDAMDWSEIIEEPGTPDYSEVTSEEGSADLEEDYYHNP